jgi:hypothetical protein
MYQYSRHACISILSTCMYINLSLDSQHAYINLSTLPTYVSILSTCMYINLSLHSQHAYVSILSACICINTLNTCINLSLHSQHAYVSILSTYFSIYLNTCSLYSPLHIQTIRDVTCIETSESTSHADDEEERDAPALHPP